MFWTGLTSQRAILAEDYVTGDAAENLCDTSTVLRLAAKKGITCVSSQDESFSLCNLKPWPLSIIQL